MKKRILFVITGLSKGGAEKQLFLLAKHIKEKYKIKVINFTGGLYVKELRDEGIKVKTIKSKSLIEKIKIIPRLVSEIKKFKPDIVHSYLPHANIFTKVSTLFMRKKFKLICSIRAKEIIDLHHNYLEKIFDFRSDLLITNSNSTKNYLVKKYNFNRNKIKVIYNGLIFQDAKKINNYYDGRIKILTIGNLKEQKDYDTNIEVCRELCKKRKDILFIYGGGGRLLNEIKSKIKKKGLEKNILVLGEITNVPELMRTCDLFFLPTLYEGQCNALIEAMFYKIPIVTTKIEENSEIVRDNMEGLLTDIKDVKSMAEKIERIFEDKKLRERLTKKAYEKSKIFEINNLINKNIEIYNKLLKCAE